MSTTASKSFVFSFADVVVREREFVIMKAGQVQPVEPKPFRVLLILLRSPNKLITKEELLNSVWGKTAVTENSLARNIALLRRLLRDDPREPRFIETVSGIGYRFICPVEVTEEPAGTLPANRSAEATHDNGSESPSLVAALPEVLRTDAVSFRSSSRTTWAAAAAIICVGLAIGLYVSRPTRPLTDEDSIVLADFTNSTGDAVFDGTLRQGLATQLEQSPFLKLVPDQQIQHTLSLMGRPKEGRLTSSAARELCQRIAAAAVVEGSIANLGKEYVISLRAMSCATGKVLGEQQIQAGRKEDVLKALSRASAQLRGKLGESLSTVEKFDTPLDEATTSSLDALLAYTTGRRKLLNHADCAAAIPLFQRAIDLDPNFAMAHLSLGLCQINTGQPGVAEESIRRAFALRQHLTEWEKLAIESRYELAVIGDLPKARQIYRLWAQIYPREPIPLSVLGECLDPVLGRYDDALADAREALVRAPQNAQYYEYLVSAYLYLHQLGNARATADEAARKGLESSDIPPRLYQLGFLTNDSRLMAQQVARAEGKPGVEDLLLSYEAATAAFAGQIEKARELSKRAIASALQADKAEAAAGYQSQWAMREALFGNLAEARHQAEAAVALSNTRDVKARSAFALALARGPAERLVEDLAHRFPEDTTVQFIFLPVIRAQLALNRRDPAGALKELDAAAPFDLANASPEQLFPFALYPCYLRGQAFLASDKAEQATVEFQRILDHPGIVINEPIGALAYKNLAHAYAALGQREKAEATYRTLMSLWRQADAINPVVRETSLEFRQFAGSDRRKTHVGPDGH
jgi:DNA-binding winged helix-turn-helix (wHTH) protein/tetratricopeptide (TPR) repeat protein